MAELKFDPDTAGRLAQLLVDANDGTLLADVGGWIITCQSGNDLLAQGLRAPTVASRASAFSEPARVTFGGRASRPPTRRQARFSPGKATQPNILYAFVFGDGLVPSHAGRLTHSARVGTKPVPTVHPTATGKADGARSRAWRLPHRIRQCVDGWKRATAPTRFGETGCA